MKEFWLTLIQNEKTMAMVIVGSICIFSIYKMELSAKDIVIPAITGIMGIVTGRLTKSESTDQPETNNGGDKQK